MEEEIYKDRTCNGHAQGYDSLDRCLHVLHHKANAPAFQQAQNNNEMSENGMKKVLSEDIFVKNAVLRWVLENKDIGLDRP